MFRRRLASSGQMLSQAVTAAPAVTSRCFSVTALLYNCSGTLRRAPYHKPSAQTHLRFASVTAVAATVGNGTQHRSFFFKTRSAEEQKHSAAHAENAASAKPPAAASPSSKLPAAPQSVTETKLEASQENSAEVTAASMPVDSHAEAQAELEAKLVALREQYLEPYDKLYHFLNPLKSTTPMVMMLGNHSSGKSTLINYLAGRKIQETGVAPTDDGFTVIRRGGFDLDADGPSVVSNPKYQFQPLQQFGISFVTHFKMKTRKMAETSRVPMDMVLVDTPGMIDTPVHNSAKASAASGADSYLYGGDHTRGYDFLGVTRWFAQQSDVILLMFDPANPGTTGETLDVLTKSLAGYEHKFLLVMNKADVFEKVTDFGRAYGTLCWNLSKVMKMKDIPRVYTTCTPLDKKAPAKGGATASVSGTVPDDELSRQRNEILMEIMSAPIRRMDNLITETEDSARNLLLAVRAARVLRQDYRQRELLVFSALSTACLVCPAAAAIMSSISLTSTVLLTLLSIAVGCGGVVTARAYLKQFERHLLDSADYVLTRIYPTKSLTTDVELRWHRIVKPEIVRAATTFSDQGARGISALPTCSARVCRGMESVVTDEIPLLRRSVTEYKENYIRKKDKSGDHAKS